VLSGTPELAPDKEAWWGAPELYRGIVPRDDRRCAIAASHVREHLAGHVFHHASSPLPSATNASDCSQRQPDIAPSSSAHSSPRRALRCPLAPSWPSGSRRGGTPIVPSASGHEEESVCDSHSPRLQTHQRPGRRCPICRPVPWLACPAPMILVERGPHTPRAAPAPLLAPGAYQRFPALLTCNVVAPDTRAPTEGLSFYDRDGTNIVPVSCGDGHAVVLSPSP
jgi:hypothetical protein